MDDWEKKAAAKIRRAWVKWKKPIDADISNYDWGFADGVHSCLSLFLEKEKGSEKRTARTITSRRARGD